MPDTKHTMSNRERAQRIADRQGDTTLGAGAYLTETVRVFMLDDGDFGVPLSLSTLERAGLAVGDAVTLTVSRGQIVLSKVSG